MCAEEQKRFFEDILSEIRIHKNLYKGIEFKSVLTRYGTTPDPGNRWRNFITLIKMAHSDTLKPWKKHIEKDNFVILTSAITIDRFKDILKRLVNEQVLEVGGYEAVGPFVFGQRQFSGSQESRRLYNIDWAVNSWIASGKDRINPPDESGLKLESEMIPFKHASDAIEYHLDMTHECYDRFQSSVRIFAPLYYARIREVDLSGRGIRVRIGCNVARPQDLRIKYSVEGRRENTSYYGVLEADTLLLVKDRMRIHLKHDAEVVNVWLYHIKGYMVDYRETRRTPSIDDIESNLSGENPYLSSEEADVITKTVDLRSKRTPDLITTERSVDSIDVEILETVRTQGGDYAQCIPEVIKYLSLDMLISRLARLRTLGFLTLRSPRKILLTPLGVDALNLPPSVLPAKVPPEIGKMIAEINLAFRNENYDEVTNKSTKLIESVLRTKLQDRFPGTVQDVWPNLNLEPYDRASLGTLKEGCLRLKVLKKNEMADHILSTILKLRVPMTHEKEAKKSAADIASLIVLLVEAFAREWYYLES